ncbi:RHS repeat protein [Pseudomonas sp. PDM03]|uniref:RHS repeat-associated core domain-containing protein n=1 Tax=Pseudomonas sp. PDM03 TaxID=2769266 RepID=UPI00178465B7|nr:RHS repeat-associated core domain-containing protein [Pseudomonas sp. PDM03]MBD9589397.1 RHS repeat protein [Pseudomonas sp. PDM03]
MAPAQWIDAHTPSLSVVDSRGLIVRNVVYCRHPLSPSIDTRITRNHFDPAGRLFASWDPRLWGTAPKPNLENTFDLQGRALRVDSVDAGWQLSLMNQADAACSFWDGRGGQRHSEFDELQRPIAVTEQMAQELPRVSERFTYGDASDERAAHNQCGQPIRHDHPAGRRSLCEYGVGGSLLAEQTRFLRDLELPDWSSEFAEAELEDEVFETTWQYGPVGEMHRQTDAMDNVRSFAYDRAGQLCEARLKLAGSSGEPRLLVSEIRYDAFGRNISERAGNGVITTARYAGEDGRLLQLQSCDVDGKPLQGFSYGYDPVGNITCIEDQAQPTRHFNNQRIDPNCCYGYDSLYQLIKATGSEVSQPSYGPALPAWQTTPLDPNQLRNYTQTFNYDAAGNLQTRHHSGAETFEMFTTTDSNRSVADQGNLVDGFDANGNQLELLRGQKMSWNVRNQLCSVTMVKRDDGPGDTEWYCYDRPGHRLRKARRTQAAHRTLRSETRYLPGLEIHRDKANGEERHVVSIEAGRGQVRALHWVAGLPRDVRNDQLRFCLSNHLNSSTLELDEQGRVLSREVYYAFGGTALWAGVSEIEARYKTIRYSGKERDATGLYCYGYRYFAPWLQRWVNPDPAGFVDGLNMFIILFNNPINWVDAEGRNAVPTTAHFFWGGGNINPVFLSNVLTFKMHNPEYQMNVWVDKPSHILNTLSAMEDGDDPIHRALARRYGRELSLKQPGELFQDLAKIFTETNKVEELFRRELEGPYRNLAAASDILRLTVTYVHGGLYMDVDVAVLSDTKPLQAPKGFLAYVTARQWVTNSTIAATPGSSLGLEFLQTMIAKYRKYDEESWTKKRGHKFWRREDTLYWTGPGLIQDPVRDMKLIIPEHMFSYRVPTVRVGGLVDDKGEVSRLFERGVHPGIAVSGGWHRIKPGRRASI